MAHAEKTVVINRPVRSVFDFVLNGANNRLWRSSVMDIKPLSEAPYGVGSKFQQGLKGPGGRIPGDYEIMEVQPNELIRFQVTAGPVRPTGTYHFESQGAATALMFVLDYQPNGLSKQMDPVETQQVFREALRVAKEEDASVLEHLSQQEKHVLQLGSEGKSNREISMSLSLGEGTIRNYIFSILSKVMDPMIQRSMNEEVGMLDELKAFMEKHA